MCCKNINKIKELSFDENALRCHLRASIFQNFPGGGMPPDPPSKSMLRMLSVLRTLFVTSNFAASFTTNICLTKVK